MTNFNERTNTLLYKNISLTLYSRKGWCLCCVWWVETGTDSYIDPSSLDHNCTFASWLGLFNRGSLRDAALSLQAGSHSDIPVSTNLTPRAPIFFHTAHLLPLFFRLFTQVHLLIDSSVKSQYITHALGLPSS